MCGQARRFEPNPGIALFLRWAVRTTGNPRGWHDIDRTDDGPSVGTYVDGFYLPSPLEADFQLNNVNNIQVLKGPQGTLFGRNTEGGAILVTTSKPSATTRADLEGAYGSYNAQIYNGYVTAGLTDKIAVDLAAIDSKGNGYTQNIWNGSDTYGAYQNSSFRAGLKVDLTDKVSVLLRLQYDSVNDPTNNMTAAFGYQWRPGEPWHRSPRSGLCQPAE